MNVTGTFGTEERLAWLRVRLASEGRVRNSEVAAALGVSEMTVRRDLQELEGMHHARRVRGGAIAVEPDPLAGRQASRARAKGRLASKLLPLVPTSGAVGVDSSSTLLRLAAIIDGDRDIQVVTNGLDTFHALQGKPGVVANLVGGRLDTATGSLVGPAACRGSRDLLLTRTFISAIGVDPGNGSTDTSIDEAEVKRAMCDVSSEIVVAVDSTKLDRQGVVRTVEWARVTTLVTELDPTDRRLDRYRKLVEIL